MTRQQNRKQIKAHWIWSALAAWLSLFALGLVDNARGPIFPDILKDFGLSDTKGSFFFFAASLASLVHNLIFHRFLSHTRPVLLVGLYTLIMGAGAALMSLAETYGLILAAASIFGMGVGGLGVGMNAAVQAAPAKYRGRALGILHSMYGISSLMAPMIISAFASSGWRRVLLALTVPSFLVGAVVLYRSILNTGETVKPVGGLPQSRIVKPPLEILDAPVKVSPLWTTQHQRASWFAALLVALLVVAEISISSRLALLARRDWGISPENVGHWLAGYFAAMTLSRMALGLFQFRLPPRRILFFAMGFGFPFLLFAFLPLGLPNEIRLVALVGFGIPIAMGYPLAMTRFAEVFGGRTQAVTSLCLIFQSAGAMVMHFTLGWGADIQGLPFILGTVSCGALLGAFVSFWAMERAVLRGETTIP